MGLETVRMGSFIVTRRNSNTPEAPVMVIKNPVYLTQDKSRAVPESDHEAAFLLCGVNATVPVAVAERYGLTENGAPGQGEAPRPPVNPAHVNPNSPDGVNTAPNTPAAVGIAAVTLAGVEVAASTASTLSTTPGAPATTPATVPAAPKAPKAPKAPAAPKGKPGRPPKPATPKA